MNTISINSHQIERKIISVSKKRQITLPLPFYNQLELGNEVECFLEDGAIVIRPLQNNNMEFSVEILKDLVSQGLSGDQLIEQFEKESKSIKKAVSSLVEEADQIAAGEKDSASYDDVFGDE